MDMLSYYSTQSDITDPGKNIEMFHDLPNDIAGLCHVVQGLIIHYVSGEELYGYKIPKERLREVDVCYVEDMLGQILEIDENPLTKARPPEKRMIGCCRDFSTLFCAMARHQGIPTRNRIGFAAYFTPGLYIDHEVVEYWDKDAKRWRLVDPEISDRCIEQYKIQFNVSDVPRDQFIVGGLAWQWCRSGKADPNKFGFPELGIKGLWFVRNRLIHDLAALNKLELLLWHTWELMDEKPEPSIAELKVLDEIASLTLAGDDAFQETINIYNSYPTLKPPSVVMSYSPGVDPFKVKLRI
jgi:hypothetical protein